MAARKGAAVIASFRRCALATRLLPPTLVVVALASLGSLAGCGGLDAAADETHADANIASDNAKPTDVAEACDRAPEWTAWVTGDGLTHVSRRTGPRSAEIRNVEGLPPLTVQAGDYVVRVLEDLTVCVDLSPRGQPEASAATGGEP